MVRWCCWRCCHCLLYACRLVLDFDVVQFTTRLWLIGGPCEFKPCIQHSISAAAWNALVSVCRCERKSSGVLLLLLLSYSKGTLCCVRSNPHNSPVFIVQTNRRSECESKIADEMAIWKRPIEIYMKIWCDRQSEYSVWLFVSHVLEAHVIQLFQ